MSTDLCVPAYLGAGPGTWREEGQSQSHIPRRPSTVLSAFPPGTSATRLAASSTASLDHHEYLKSGPGVLLQSVWGVVAEKEQRFGVQPRVTRSAYSRRRSLSGAVKRGRKEKGLTKKLVKGLEGHDSQTAVEILGKEHTQPNQPQPIEAEEEYVCAIDARLSAATGSGNSEQSNQVKDSTASKKPPTSPTSSPPADPHPPPKHNMSSRSSRHSSFTSSSSSHSHSHSHTHTQTRSSTSSKSFSPSSPKPASPSPSPSPSSPQQKFSHTGKEDKEQEDKTADKDDWHQIHEPEQRRRIQNRIAQRKFREKARLLKDQAARDAQNRRYAGCAYTCPEVGDLPVETYEVEDENGSGGGSGSGGYYFDGEGFEGVVEEKGEGTAHGGEMRDGVGGERVLSGLPWGGLSMRYMVGRGHEYYRYQSTSRGSGSGSGTGTVTSLSPTNTALNTPTPTPTHMSTTTSGDTWPTLQQRQQAATYYRHTTSGDSGASPLSPYGMMMPMGMDLMSGGDMDMDMDVDYSMAGTGAGGEYVTSPMAVTPGSGSGSGGHGGASVLGNGTGTGMDVTYYDSSPYYYDYGRGGDAASGSGSSVYGRGGGRGGRM
ncbi:hypothetical protein B0H65DRAFT_100418 [Neurospora tetraspora]|uniref:BZIP domain-containing protein n=1 Tax=Neurospora tetraspora TaxID=94610 RepID=A0AAE0MTS3_9PEZI|nr:hypothetical protein B0H65DRAFT_100418 [Neurospora tetraspora]